MQEAGKGSFLLLKQQTSTAQQTNPPAELQHQQSEGSMRGFELHTAGLWTCETLLDKLQRGGVDLGDTTTYRISSGFVADFTPELVCLKVVR